MPENTKQSRTNKTPKPKTAPGKKPASRPSKDLARDTVLRMRQACEILYPIANGLGILRAPAASLEPVHRDTLEMIRTFCNHMEMHLDRRPPGAASSTTSASWSPWSAPWKEKPCPPTPK